MLLVFQLVIEEFVSGNDSLLWADERLARSRISQPLRLMCKRNVELSEWNLDRTDNQPHSLAERAGVDAESGIFRINWSTAESEFDHSHIWL